MVPPAMQSPNPQLTQQFLSSVLSQRGPLGLPYSQDTKRLIHQHLVALTATYTTLEAKTAIFTHNDGRSVNLLEADGTIPMTFQGITYNIAVVIWLMESYPRHPPCVYVNPSRDTIIKRPHPHVNPSGMVSVPYLQNWIYPSSNLVDLVRNLSAFFGRNPPLYSQCSAPPLPSATSSSPSSNFEVDQCGSSTSFSSDMRSSSGYANQLIHPRSYSPSPYPAPPHTEDSTEAFKRDAINKLVEMVRTDVAELRKTMEAEMEGLLNLQEVLRKRKERLNKNLKETEEEMESLEQQLRMTLMNTDAVEGWIRKTQDKMENLEDVDDDPFKCVDVLATQMLECTASDLAIEDVVYSLDKAVQTGAVPFDQYLKNVRSLSRDQFVHLAKAAKVRDAQLQAQVANMAARTSYYGS